MRTSKPHARPTCPEPIQIALEGTCVAGRSQATNLANSPQPEALLNLVRALAREAAAEAVRITAAGMADGEPEPSKEQP